MIETVEVRSEDLATSEAIEAAYLNNSDGVAVHYRQESGNSYSCFLSEFSLGEAAIILKAVADTEPGSSGTDRHVSLMNKWAGELKDRLEKEYANRVQ